MIEAILDQMLGEKPPMKLTRSAIRSRFVPRINDYLQQNHMLNFSTRNQKGVAIEETFSALKNMYYDFSRPYFVLNPTRLEYYRGITLKTQ